MKAVVLDVRGHESVVLMKDGTVKTVKARYRVGDEVNISTRKAGGAKRLIAAAAAAAVLATGGLWYDQNMVACAEVSLDLNPSIVYTLNRRSRVLSVRAENEEAQNVVASLVSQHVKNSTLADALAKTMRLLETDGYLSQEGEDYVLVGIATDSEATLAALEGQVEAVLEGDAGITYAVSSTDSATARSAREAGVSPGRYSAWQEVTDADDTALEDFRSMNVRDIIQPPERPRDGEPRQTAPDMANDAAPNGNPPGEPLPDADAPGERFQDTAQPDDHAPASQPVGDDRPDADAPGSQPSEAAPPEGSQPGWPGQGDAPGEPPAADGQPGNVPMNQPQDDGQPPMPR